LSGFKPVNLVKWFEHVERKDDDDWVKRFCNIEAGRLTYTEGDDRIRCVGMVVSRIGKLYSFKTNGERKQGQPVNLNSHEN